MIKICNRIIEYSFYSLFLLVPLAFTSKTSELFELNKMWLTWGLTIVITATWFTKMILQKKFLFQRTPLDIPIGIFLLSQIISTIFSLDTHTSFWGYYSRFNGGLLSIISYILLYYAFLSNLGRLRYLRRLIFLSLISGLIVALWGLPSHFGYDPTCLLFRGTLDVSCWTADFMPRARIFSTLGQPAWLAAYLAILIPIAIAFLLKNSKSEARNPKQSQNSNSQILKTFLNFGHWNLFRISIFVLLILFYVDLLYTRTRSGFLGIWGSLFLLISVYFLCKAKFSHILLTILVLVILFITFIFNIAVAWIPLLLFVCTYFSYQTIKLIISYKSLAFTILTFFFITFIIGTPFSQLNNFTLDGLKARFEKIKAPHSLTKKPPAQNTTVSATPITSGGTESADIRRYVWAGAINAWKANPLIGTGVETFAFAYYKYKPAGQNLTSEWNFLYNKAHNEYLNFLATTGLFGLGSYLLMIGYFLFITFRYLFSVVGYQNFVNRFSVNQSDKLKTDKLESENGKPRTDNRILIIALLASCTSILITNFFGFSVVITNIYLFMIPAFVFVLSNMIKDESNDQRLKTNDQNQNASIWQWTPIFFILLACLFSLITLFRFWQADVAFALGYNLDRAGEYQQAYPHLHKAVKIRGGEPVFKDELSINNAILATALIAQKPQDEKAQEQIIKDASSLAQQAINVSNDIISGYQNNTVFWKTRTKLFYTLSQVDSRYLPRALDAITKAYALAPNDANILYNLGILYGQNNNLAKGIEALEKTIKLKPDYRDAHYALGLFYNEAGKKDKAIEQMQYILGNISPQDAGAKESIKSWTIDK